MASLAWPCWILPLCLAPSIQVSYFPHSLHVPRKFLSAMPSTCLYACPPETTASFRRCSNARPSKRGRSWGHSADAAATISLWAAKPRGSQEFLSKPLKTAWRGFRFRQRSVSLSGRVWGVEFEVLWCHVCWWLLLLKPSEHLGIFISFIIISPYRISSKKFQGKVIETMWPR